MGKASKNKASSRSEAAAEIAAQEAARKKRERMVRILGGAVVGLVVLGIIGVAFAARGSDPVAEVGVVDPGAVLPATVLPVTDTRALGVPYGSATGVPVLEIWEDFQCPACAALEEVAGANITSLADQGKVQVVWRPATFLDRNLGNDSSKRAAAAWGCAIDAGKAREYHDTVFASQPEVEGDGYTDEQLLAFGKTAGIEGAAYDTFTQCVADSTYLGWAESSSALFETSGITSTPSILLNGQLIENSVVADPATLASAVDQAAAAAGVPVEVTPSAPASTGAAASPAATPFFPPSEEASPSAE